MEQLVVEIARVARSGPALLGDTHLVTIDGPAGSGKSSLARRLEVELGDVGGTGDADSTSETQQTAETSFPSGRLQQLPTDEGAGELGAVATIHLDDLYEGWTGLNSTLFNRLEAWVILPLVNSLPARFLVYDWAQMRFTHWDEVRPHPYIIIEGVGAGDVVTRKWATTKLWLDVSDETGCHRGLARDSTGRLESGISPELREQWSLWQRSQADYFASSGNRYTADFCIDTTQL